jgi:hypothetical protein
VQCIANCPQLIVTMACAPAVDPLLLCLQVTAVQCQLQAMQADKQGGCHQSWEIPAAAGGRYSPSIWAAYAEPATAQQSKQKHPAMTERGGVSTTACSTPLMQPEGCMGVADALGWERLVEGQRSHGSSEWGASCMGSWFAPTLNQRAQHENEEEDKGDAIDRMIVDAEHAASILASSSPRSVASLPSIRCTPAQQPHAQQAVLDHMEEQAPQQRQQGAVSAAQQHAQLAQTDALRAEQKREGCRDARQLGYAVAAAPATKSAMQCACKCSAVPRSTPVHLQAHAAVLSASPGACAHIMAVPIAVVELVAVVRQPC